MQDRNEISTYLATRLTSLEMYLTEVIKERSPERLSEFQYMLSTRTEFSSYHQMHTIYPQGLPPTWGTDTTILSMGVNSIVLLTTLNHTARVVVKLIDPFDDDWRSLVKRNSRSTMLEMLDFEAKSHVMAFNLLCELTPCILAVQFIGYTTIGHVSALVPILHYSCKNQNAEGLLKWASTVGEEDHIITGVVLEAGESTLVRYTKVSQLSFRRLVEIIFLILHSIKLLQMKCGMRHNDMHSGNIIMVTQEKAVAHMFKVNNKQFFIEPHVMVPTIADFGMASLFGEVDRFNPKDTEDLEGIASNEDFYYDAMSFLGSIEDCVVPALATNQPSENWTKITDFIRNVTPIRHGPPLCNSYNDLVERPRFNAHSLFWTCSQAKALQMLESIAKIKPELSVELASWSMMTNEHRRSRLDRYMKLSRDPKCIDHILEHDLFLVLATPQHSEDCVHWN